MLSPEQVESINDTLLAKFGRVFDRPKYRLSWSTSQFEYRYFDGTEYYLNIKLRDVKAMKSMPKYPKDKDRWVLEILVEIPVGLKEELVGDNGLTYEPLWVFKKDEEYQEPTEYFITFVAFLSHVPIEVALDSDSDLWKRDKKELQHCLDLLDDALPDLAVALKQGSAAFIDSTKRLT